MIRLHAVSKDEVIDLKTLLACTVVTPVIWFVAFHWRPHLSMAGEDALSQSLLWSKILSDVHGDWTNAVYYLNLLGGVKTNDTLGTPPLFQLCAWLGLYPITSLNFAFLFAQTAYAFLGIRAANDLAGIWRNDAISHEWWSRFGMIGLLAFAPALGTRLIHGHFFLAYGALVFIAAMSLILAARRNSLTRTLCLISLLVMVHAFSTSAHQTVLYGAIFGAPILLVLMRPFRGTYGAITLAVALCAAMTLSAPKFVGMLDNATGNDGGRQLGGPSVIYSGAPSTAIDWISSIPWGKSVIPTGRPEGDFHEINFGFGPPLILLFLLPWRKFKGIVCMLTFSAALAVAFSMNAPGVATLLTRLIPVINSFRAPQRAILSFALALPIVSVAAILYYSGNEQSQWNRRRSLILLLLAGLVLALLFTHSVEREVILWVCTLAILIFRRAVSRDAWAPCMLIFFFSIGTLLAFQERLLPLDDGRDVIRSSQSVGDYLLREHPSLSSPLERTAFGFGLASTGINSPAFMNLSTMSGYWFAPRRFMLLANASEGVPFAPTMNVFAFFPSDEEFPIMHRLYNVTGSSQMIKGVPTIVDAGATPGPAWFSADVAPVPTIESMVSALQAYKDGAPGVLRRRFWIVESDNAVKQAGVPATISPECERSEVLAVDAKPYLPVRAHVRSLAACPVTFAMNYTSTLHGRILNAPARALTLFPAYGALTAAIVPPGEWDIEVNAAAVSYWWSELAFYLGIALTIVLLTYCSRMEPKSRVLEP